jgi:hypothetical protein
MNKQPLTFCAALILGAATAAFAQSPPANDNFTNRIALTGSSFTFTGTLAGATYEFAEYSVPGDGLPGGSVWWTWTAPIISRVVIEIPANPFTTNAELEVYTGTALNALTRMDANHFGFPPGRFVSFMAYPTNTYQFRVIGSGTQPFSLRLTVTNPPIFMSQPQDCVVSPFGSAFFSAMATGPSVANIYPPPPSPTSYQWSFNGVPLPGQSSPSLIIHSVTTNQAGTYSVIASNVGGVTQGGSATLTVIDTNPVPQIAAVHPTNSSKVPLFVSGESGRWYKLETSPDLHFWFSVVRQLTNTSDIFSLFKWDYPINFARASLDVPTDACNAQLKQMWWAQKAYTIEGRHFPNEVLFSINDLRPYVPLTPQGNIHPCPAAGMYASGGSLTNPPTCSLSTTGGHKLTDLP